MPVGCSPTSARKYGRQWWGVAFQHSRSRAVADSSHSRIKKPLAPLIGHSPPKFGKATKMGSKDLQKCPFPKLPHKKKQQTNFAQEKWALVHTTGRPSPPKFFKVGYYGVTRPCGPTPLNNPIITNLKKIQWRSSRSSSEQAPPSLKEPSQ